MATMVDRSSNALARLRHTDHAPHFVDAGRCHTHEVHAAGRRMRCSSASTPSQLVLSRPGDAIEEHADEATLHVEHIHAHMARSIQLHCSVHTGP